MPQFPHLPLPKRVSAPFKFTGRPMEKKVAEQTLRNQEKRRKHGQQLKQAINELSNEWNNNLLQRVANDLPDLPNESVIPLLLRIDTTLFSPESLYSFGIDVIAESEEGYIIGASTDNFKSLKEKIDKFIAEDGKYKNKAAQLWDIALGTQWRVDYILSPELKAVWDKLPDSKLIVVDVSIACNLKIPAQPTPKKDETEKSYLTRYKRWSERKDILENNRYELEERRQEEFSRFVDSLGGILLGSFVSYSDSFGCRIELSGGALKDLVLNYQYLFDVTEYDTLRFISSLTGEEEGINVQISAPEKDAPKVCVIDSGMQEGHHLLNAAIKTAESRSYLSGNSSVADEVSNGGHGTKVAGAVLYANDIPKTGNHKPDIWLYNAKVLSARNILPNDLFPPTLMEKIVADFSECQIFNLSITANRACKVIHMSQWATAIDKIMAANEKLFVIAAGNIAVHTGSGTNPGIREQMAAGRSYPTYLFTRASRIANPAQSCFALTVGSVCHTDFEDDDRISFGKANDASAFTRVGPGMWNMIKPDVVEYGGDFIREKAGANPAITELMAVSAEVVKTTARGNNAVGYDNGTSYAAPKVSHIAGKILNTVPAASPNLIRALIIQSARLPNKKLMTPTQNDVRLFGYGIPDVLRATENSKRRITMVSEGKIAAKEAQIFTINIPKEIRRAGNDYSVLVEVTLTFTATPRRTRRYTHSYLSTWVDWQSSKHGESYKQFRSRVTKLVEDEDYDIMVEDAEESIQWNIRENRNWGQVRDYRRQDSSAQKDWTIIKSFRLPEEFSIAVIGHKGWEQDVFKKVPFALAVSFEVLNAEVDIYNLIKVENEIEAEVEV